MDLSKRVFGSNVDPKIIKYFKDLEGGSFSTIGPNESLSVPFNVNVRPGHSSYLGDRTPFARMWTAVNTFQTGSNIPAGSETFNNLVYIINSNRENSPEFNIRHQVINLRMMSIT